MKYLRQMMVILGVAFAAEVLEYLIPIPVAASVYGLVLMFLLLVFKIVPLEKVEGAGDFLADILPIVFVPVTVGIVDSIDELMAMLVPTFVICIVTTVIVMAVTGRFAQFIIRRDDKKKGTAQDEKQERETR